MSFPSITHHITSLNHWLFPQSCFLCGGISTKVVCTACLADLPFSDTTCQHCGKPSEEDVKECDQCRLAPPPYTHTQSVFSYAYPINTLIPAAKFHQNLAVLNLLGHLMAQRLTIEPRPDILVPVPLHRKRLRERGYNQSLELAKRITKMTGIPLEKKACKRVIDTKAQTSLATAQERQENLKGAFQLTRYKSDWQHIVLIDDVMTTGSTVTELAIVFKDAGIKRVDVWCCARR
jgi:ComF family protein